MLMVDPAPLITAASLPTNFQISEVHPLPRATGTPAPVPPLGPLAAFTGNWSGTGLNTIFRPDSSNTPTGLPTPVSGSDNVLELESDLGVVVFLAESGIGTQSRFGFAG